MTALRLLPPVAWTAVVAWLSTPTWSGEHTVILVIPALHWLLPALTSEQLAAWHGLARKAAHVTEYAVLAGLWYWALRPRGVAVAARAALGLALLTAVVDEVHQLTASGRGGSAADVALDTAGALAALIVLRAGPRATADRLTSVLLWVAAAGGTALLAAHWTLQAPSGWLWWSTPAAWIALGVRWMTRRDE